MIDLRCHCGGVVLTLPHPPVEITRCNCSMCRVSGFEGVYYPEGAVTVSGDLEGYVRSDLADPCLTMWRCRTCGIPTHWTLLDAWPYADSPRPDRMGVNARLLDPALAATLPIKYHDGATE